MLNHNMLLSFILLLTSSFVLGQRECNRTLPEFDDHACRRLRTPGLRLIKHLFKEYNRDVRPVVQSHASTPINMVLHFLRITKVNEADQKLGIHAWVALDWVDEYLQWDYEEFSRQRNVRVPANKIWTPDITLFTGVDEFSSNSNYDPLVENNGKVIWIVPKNLESSCSFDMRFFPYDEQSCSFTFGSWVYNSYQINFRTKEQALDMSMAEVNREWKISSTNVTREDKKFPCCPESYTTITFKFNLSRGCSNYRLFIILPLIVLSIFSFLIFLFPVGSNARIGFALFVLTGFFVILVYIQSIASSSQTTPLLSIYTIVMISILSFAIVVLIAMANLSARTGTMPSFLRDTLCKSCRGGKNDENEWKAVASCLDIFFFALFLIAIILFIIVFIILFFAL